LKICDLTQFYSPFSGGVKRYVHEKINYIQTASREHEHILIVPGPRTEMISADRSRLYSVHSPLVSRSSRYRVFLNLRAIDEILERERPDIIESADPYQLGWKAISSGHAFRIPVVGFYHSHFPDAYLRGASRRLGQRAGGLVMAAARRYVRKLYNQMEATLVPSIPLAGLLETWGVRQVRPVRLGVNTNVFRVQSDENESTSPPSSIGRDRTLLLYVGRLAPEKNTTTLFEAFAVLARRRPNEFHLLVIGDGPERNRLRRLRAETENITWIPYCTDALELARYYRAADMFVHPGTQETFGLVALESQACGTPVLGIRGSAMDRVIFHEQEMWARENTPEALAAAIEAFSGRHLATIGEGAARRAEREYGWPGVFERLFCIYREVCANYGVK
jgi:alpha-1,6-mannosyltransferase